MPKVIIPPQFTKNFVTEWKNDAKSVQELLRALIHHTDPCFSKFKNFFSADAFGHYHPNGIIICINGHMLTNADASLNVEDEVAFLPSLSGG